MPDATGFHRIERTALGLRMRGTPLYLDPLGRPPLGFLAHARGVRGILPERVVATAESLQLVELERPRALRRSAPLPTALQRQFSLGGLTLALHAAGHVLGSAQLQARGPDGGVVYAGDLGGAKATACALPEPRAQLVCDDEDLLLLRASYGHPRYRLPPRAEVLEEVERFVRETLARGAAPLLLAAPLGGAQEIAFHLGTRGMSVRMHPACWRVAEVYRARGQPLAGSALLEGRPSSGEVVVLPYDARSRRAAPALAPYRTCILSGRALDPDFAAKVGADLALPLSDHAGFDSLVEYAVASRARRVLTVHGHAEDLAGELRRRGIAARALGHERQLALPGF